MRMTRSCRFYTKRSIAVCSSKTMPKSTGAIGVNLRIGCVRLYGSKTRRQCLTTGVSIDVWFKEMKWSCTTQDLESLIVDTIRLPAVLIGHLNNFPLEKNSNGKITLFEYFSDLHAIMLIQKCYKCTNFENIPGGIAWPRL